MTMEERFEAILKKCEYLQAHHAKMKNHAYLKRSIKQRRAVEIPEFEGRLDPDEFLEWLQAVERVFEFKEILEDKKVKLVALKLRSFASLWWTSLLAKRVRQGKRKILMEIKSPWSSRTRKGPRRSPKLLRRSRKSTLW